LKDKIVEKFFKKNDSLKITRKQLRAAKLKAAGFEDGDIAHKLGMSVGNLSRLFKTLNRNYRLMQRVLADVRKGKYLIESPLESIRRLKKTTREIAESERYPGGHPLFGAILKDGWFFPGKEYEDLIKILRRYADGEGPSSLSGDFKLTRHKIQTIVRDMRYDNWFIHEGKVYRGGWPRLVPEKLWNRVQERHRPERVWDPIFGYEWINKRRVINAERAGICKYIVKKYLSGEPPSKTRKALLKEKITTFLFYSILSDERRTGWIMKDGKLVPSSYPEIITRSDWKKVQKILKSKKRWNDLLKKRVDGKKTIKSKIRSLIPCYRDEIYTKIPERSLPTITHIIKKMKEKEELQEREDGLLYFYGLPPEDIPMRMTRETRVTDKMIVDCMPAYRWQIQEKLKLSGQTTIAYVKKLKEKDILKEREDCLLQKKESRFPERCIETRFKHESEKRRKILRSFVDKEEITRKELKWKTGFAYGTLDLHVRKLKLEGYLEGKNGKFRLSDRSILSKLSAP